MSTKEKDYKVQAANIELLKTINAVEGFRPELLAACYRTEEGDQMYLQAAPAMRWFRLKYPHGKLEQVAFRVNDSAATVEGRVYDEQGNLLANAYATRRFNAEDPYGKDYIQNAGTAAIRKALGNAGFGTPCDAEYIEGVTPLFEAEKAPEVPVETMVPTKRTPPPPVPKKKVKAEPFASKPIMVEDDPPIVEQEPEEKEVKIPPRPVKDYPPETPPQPKQPESKPVKAEELKPAKAVAAPPVSEPTPEPKTEPEEPETIEQALAFKISVGRYKGKTFGELLDGGEKRAITYFLQPIYNGTPIHAAASLVAGQYNL